MQIDNQAVATIESNEGLEMETQTAGPPISRVNEGMGGIEETIEVEAARVRRVRHPKEIISDEATALRNMTLAEWNNGYVANMTEASKQKQQNKLQTICKKNAAFWVFGQGIGSVGMGVGMEQQLHPLRVYSGEDLFDAVGGYIRKAGQKRRADADGGSEGRRVRPREQKNHLSHENIDRLDMDVELGRDAPSSLYDDHSSQMPWNITASLQSSQQKRRYRSVSEISSQGRKGRSRLTSASPLAGRSYLGGRDRLSLEPLGDFGDDLDLTRYLEGELATDREHISSLSPAKRSAPERVMSTLDRESLNFIDFMKTRMDALVDGKAGSTAQSPRSKTLNPVAGKYGQTTFASLLPPGSTTRAVATQALMNVLTLATKGVLHVHQDGYIDESTEWEVHYRYGEIFMRLSGM